MPWVNLHLLGCLYLGYEESKTKEAFQRHMQASLTQKAQSQADVDYRNTLKIWIVLPRWTRWNPQMARKQILALILQPCQSTAP